MRRVRSVLASKVEGLSALFLITNSLTLKGGKVDRNGERCIIYDTLNRGAVYKPLY
jgi:hypothetical protein